MKTRLFLHLALKPIFWDLRSIMLKFLFWQKNINFKIKYYFDNLKFGASSFKQFLSMALRMLTTSFLLTVIFQLIDPYLQPIYAELGWKFLDRSEYVTFLATISGIGGVFIGLYYASISAAGSTIYAKVPDGIRTLLIKERFGNFYMNFLAFVTFLGIMLIAFQVLGYSQIYSIIPFMIIFSGIGIVCFIKLGQRAFYLFDPTKLSYRIFQEFSKWLNLVIANNSQWQDPSFQSHAHQNASENLNTLEALSDFIAKEKHLKGESFLELSKSILLFLYNYEEYKQKIPSNSHWYKRKEIHEDWYKLNRRSLIMHINNGTFIQPKEVNDKDWVEKKCLPIVMQCLKINISSKNYLGIIKINRTINTYTKQLAVKGYVDKGFNFSTDLTNIILNSFLNADNEISQNDNYLEMAIVQYFALLPTSMLLSYTESLTNVNRNNIENIISSIDWYKDKSIYHRNFSMDSLEKLERLSQCINLEKNIDGKIITPLWYITDIICEAEIRKFILNIEALVSQGGDFYLANIEKTCNSEYYIFASVIASSAIEYWNKLEHFLNDWKEVWLKLGNERYIDNPDFEQITFSFENLIENVSEKKNKLLLQIAYLVFLLRDKNHDCNYPDYKGQFMHYLAENLIDLLLDNNKEVFKKVFPLYLDACYSKCVKLFPSNIDIENWQNKHELKQAMIPLLDLMEISGYAKLMSDYYEDETLSQLAKQFSDRYIEAGINKQRIIATLSLAVSFYSDHNEGLRYSPLHFEWNKRIHQKIQTIERCSFQDPDNRAIIPIEIIKHRSALVRIFADDRLSNYTFGIDIFSHFYLQEIDNTGTLKELNNRLGLKSRLEYNEQEYKKYTEFVNKTEKK